MGAKRFVAIAAAVFALGLTTQAAFAVEPEARATDAKKSAEVAVAAGKEDSRAAKPERYSFWSTRKSARQETQADLRREIQESNVENRIFKKSGITTSRGGH